MHALKRLGHVLVGMLVLGPPVLWAQEGGGKHEAILEVERATRMLRQKAEYLRYLTALKKKAQQVTSTVVRFSLFLPKFEEDEKLADTIEMYLPALEVMLDEIKDSVEAIGPKPMDRFYYPMVLRYIREVKREQMDYYRARIRYLRSGGSGEEPDEEAMVARQAALLQQLELGEQVLLQVVESYDREPLCDSLSSLQSSAPQRFEDLQGEYTGKSKAFPGGSSPIYSAVRLPWGATRGEVFRSSSKYDDHHTAVFYFYEGDDSTEALATYNTMTALVLSCPFLRPAYPIRDGKLYEEILVRHVNNTAPRKVGKASVGDREVLYYVEMEACAYCKPRYEVSLMMESVPR